MTERIGLVATVSTTYNEPYNLARKFASLDFLSGGRAGWNLVTSANQAEALNFNRDEHMQHSLRYERAREFVGVVTGLWDSWDDDAFVRDQESRSLLRARQAARARAQGKALLGARAAQRRASPTRPSRGRPGRVLATTGQDLAAETAEVIFHRPADALRGAGLLPQREGAARPVRSHRPTT